MVKTKGRKKRQITQEMIDDVRVLGKDEFCLKHECGEMFFLNLYYKEVRPEVKDVFDGVLMDTNVLYENGAATYIRYIQDKQSEADLACQDILHRIQKEEMTNAEKLEMFDLLVFWRKERIKYSDTAEFYNMNRNKVVDLIELMKVVDMRKKFLTDRVYRVRKLAEEFGKDVI